MIIQDVDHIEKTGGGIVLRMFWIHVPRAKPAREKSFPAWFVSIELVDFARGTPGEGQHFSIALSTVWAYRSASCGAWMRGERRMDGGTRVHSRFALAASDAEAYLAGETGKVVGPWDQVSFQDASTFDAMLPRALTRWMEYFRTGDAEFIDPTGEPEVVFP